MEKYKEIEKSIIKKFRKQIWSRFTAAITDYDLIQSETGLQYAYQEARTQCCWQNVCSICKNTARFPLK